MSPIDPPDAPKTAATELSIASFPTAEELAAVAKPIQNNREKNAVNVFMSFAQQFRDAATSGDMSVTVPLALMPDEELWKSFLPKYGYSWALDPANPSVVIISWG
jgi:hypothetical protein